MKVYHGSTMNVKKPIVTRGRNKTDFGKGFYTTTNIEQARDWAIICQQKMGSGVKAIVSTYEIDDNLLDKNEYDILKFSAPDKEWLKFVKKCRYGTTHGHDVVFGPVADDSIYATFDLYEAGLLSEEETVDRLKIKPYYNQFSFHSPAAVRELRFVESVEVDQSLNP